MHKILNIYLYQETMLKSPYYCMQDIGFSATIAKPDPSQLKQAHRKQLRN